MQFLSNACAGRTSGRMFPLRVGLRQPHDSDSVLPVSLESLLTLSMLQLWCSKTDYFDKYSSVAQLMTPTTTCIHRSSLTGLCAFIPFTTACHHTLLVSYVHVTVIPAITVAGIRDERRRKPEQTVRNSLP